MAKENKGENNKAGSGKVGVYICYCGGNISDQVDVEKVRDQMEELPEVAVARTNMFMCSDPGQEMIMEDLKNGTIDRVVVASCAPSLHETTFRSAISRAGANPYVYEHANIREQVSWVHHGDQATKKAARLISMASAKADKLTPLAPIQVEAVQKAAVIGGGIAGLSAARDLAKQGFEVTLIEKSPFLGGQLARLDRLAPFGDRAGDLLVELAGQVLGDELITVYSCARVVTFEGYIGNFKLGIKLEPQVDQNISDTVPRAGDYIPLAGVTAGKIPDSTKNFTIEAGVIVMATGLKTYQPHEGEYGFKVHPEVVTLSDLIVETAQNPNTGDFLEYQGRKIRSLAMIHCVGSRQIPGVHPENENGSLNEYCSRTCCSAILNAANNIRTRYPNTRVFEFYRDIRTYGRGQEELYEEASTNQVVFLRFEADDSPQVGPPSTQTTDYPLSVKVNDTLTFGEEVEAPVDLVVLATGTEAGPISELVEMMKLPVGPDRFLLEVHPKLRPVELPVSGIFLAGTCQAPMDVGEAVNAAGAAAAKAGAILGRGRVELDPFVAEVNQSKCIGCGDCVQACLGDEALELVDLDEGGQTLTRARVNPARCQGCGACVAVCPENAIDIAGWTLKQYEAMVDRIVADKQAA
jgi:heterodisulfide reductase subunit A